MKDHVVIEQSKSNPDVYGQIYKKYADKVFNYFWYRTGHDHALSEDLMQETFVRAFENRGKYQQRGYSYLTYLLTIAHNILIDHYRKPKNIPVDELESDKVPYEITDDLMRKSDAESLWRAIQSLPASNRDALLMFYQEDMPIKDIAKVLDSTENAVKLNLSRTRKRLASHPYLQDIRGFRDKKRAYTKPRYLKK